MNTFLTGAGPDIVIKCAMMDRVRLSSLPLDKQVEIIHKTGTYLSKRSSDGRRVLLFSLGNEYAEVHYITYRCSIDKIIYSFDPDILDPYLEQVDIHNVIE